ncbi:MAG: hypothetical protein M3R17_06920 [Bacteroidota bacterium]|nr:hypothetical protein [Bacteroidota bacterium]
MYHLILSERATVSDVVDILGICKKRKAQQFAIIGQDVWIWSGNYLRPLIVKKISPVCGNTQKCKVLSVPVLTCGTVYNGYSEVKQVAKKDILTLFFQNPHRVIFILSFFALIVFSFFSIRMHFIRS